MKVKSFKYLVIVLCTLFSCTANQGLKNEKENFFSFSIKTANKKYKKKEFFTIEIPSGGNFSKNKFKIHAHQEELLITYPDSSVLYFSNDIENGSELNLENRFKAGISSYYQRGFLDTIDNSGLQVYNNHFWRERISGGIVVGYLDVPKERKNEFDKTLMSLKNYPVGTANNN